MSLQPTELYLDDEKLPKSGTPVSGAATYYSKRMNCQGESRASMHAIWTGTVSGAFTVQTSNDSEAATDSDSGWVDEVVGMPVNPSGSDGSTLQHFFENGAEWIRLKYVNASGSGTLRCIGTVKP